MSKTLVLLADDDESHQRLLVSALRRAEPSVEVTCASRAAEIERALSMQRFDCLVLDFNMPPDSAATVLDRVGGLLRGTPVVVVSSSREQCVVIESMRSGVGDFIPKEDAIRPGLLWERVRRAVQEARESREERRERRRRMRAMEKLADTDALTGLYNRRYIDRFIEAERSRTDRRRCIACVMADVDHFKGFNDRFGHAAGDEVLRATARVLREAAGTGVVGRWGGEEFIAFVHPSGLAEAWHWADSVRERVAASSLGGEALSEAELTVSLGVATGSPSELGAEMIRRADMAMYLAKDCGRDRTCTGEMVEAMEVAERLSVEPGIGVEHRFDAWFGAMASRLGPVQIEHVGEHGEAVRRLTARLLGSMGLGASRAEELCLAARLHDIGKVCVPEALLAKPAALTTAEKRCVDSHARFGADLARALGATEYTCGVIAAHHDRFDGRGRGLVEPADDETKRGAAVVSAADAVVAMMTDRPYAIAMDGTEALREVRSQRGFQFAPEVVDELGRLGPCALAA